MSKYNFVSKELKDFKPEDYHYFGLWKNDLFATCFWQESWVPDLVKKLGLKSDGIYAINLKGGHYLVSKSEIENIHNQISDKINKKDESFFKKMVEVADNEFTLAVKIGEDLKDAEPNIKNFKLFVDAAKRVNLLWQLGADRFVIIAEKKLKEVVVKENFPTEYVMEIIPKVQTPLYYRYKELVKLKKEIGNKSFSQIIKDKILIKKMQDQVEKYPWIEIFNFNGDRLTIEKLYEQVKHIENVEESTKDFPEENISTELKFRARCMYYCGYIKQAGAEYFSIFSEKVMPFLKNIAKKIDIDYTEFRSLSISEIEQALQGKISKKDLKSRAKRRMGYNDWILIGDKEGKTIFVEEPLDIKFLVGKMIPVADKSQTEIKGVVGNSGKYSGICKVILNTEDFHKMETGDVIVTTMTTPDFVILMQKSGAIVTDIGGILSHASIVSREINKPCIIGTRFATQILKDGDLVEVDANEGIVRIIERKK
ncbi:MAG: PEP-utilizing enzyme [Nanoarchaeota archaeon]